MKTSPPPSALRVMVFDVDGVLTDGRLYFDDEGRELKAFHTLDGQGIRLLQAAGILPAIVTGRRSGAVAARAKGLGIVHVFQNVHDKRACLAELLAELGMDWSEIGYMGDDLIDLAALSVCDFAAAPANAHPRVLAIADYVTTAKGGEGAVREVCEYILTAQGKLDDAIAACLGAASWDSP